MFRWIRRYFSIVFVLATLLGVMHHHDGYKIHNDCKICTINSNIVDGDTPVETLYLTKLELKSESILTKLQNLHSKKHYNTLQARAPPKIS